MIPEVVVLPQLVECGPDVIEAGVRIERHQLFRRDRTRRGEERGFK